MTKDLSRHVENECQKNLNSSPSPPSTQNQTTNDKTPTFIDMTKSQYKPSSRNSILKDTVNVSDFLSGSDESTEEYEIESNLSKRNQKTQPKPQKKQLSRSNSRSRK